MSSDLIGASWIENIRIIIRVIVRGGRWIFLGAHHRRVSEGCHVDLWGARTSKYHSWQRWDCVINGIPRFIIFISASTGPVGWRHWPRLWSCSPSDEQRVRPCSVTWSTRQICSMITKEKNRKTKDELWARSWLFTVKNYLWKKP